MSAQYLRHISDGTSGDVCGRRLVRGTILALSVLLGITCARNRDYEKIVRTGWTARSIGQSVALEIASGRSCSDAIKHASTAVDPWGVSFRLSCANRATVTSAGPDGNFDTPDDIEVVINGADEPLKRQGDTGAL